MKPEIIAMIISIVAMIVTTASFQFTKKSQLLLVQTIGSALYLVSYIFASGGMAIYLNILFIIRNFVSTKTTGNRRASNITAVILCILIIIIYILFIVMSKISTTVALWNALPVMGSIFGTIGFTRENPKHIRMWKIGDSISWLCFNLHLGIAAMGGIIGEVINLSSIGISLLRLKNKQ